MKGWRLIYVGMAAMVAIALVAQFAGSDNSGGSGIALAATVDIAAGEEGTLAPVGIPAAADSDGLGRTAIYLGAALFVLLLAPVGLLSMLRTSRPLSRLGSTDRPSKDAYSLQWMPAGR